MSRSPAYVAASGDALVPVLLPFYAAYRALVRAKVDALESDAAEVDAAIDRWVWYAGWTDKIAQIAGAISGVLAAHAMFGERLFMLSTHQRSGGSQMFSEFIATFGLVSVIWGCARTRAAVVPFAVAAYIVAAYWFTASTSFANPAVSLARAFTDTFAGIRPADVPGFVTAQCVGGAVATPLFRWLVPALPARAGEVVVPHPQARV